MAASRHITAHGLQRPHDLPERNTAQLATPLSRPLPFAEAANVRRCLPEDARGVAGWRSPMLLPSSAVATFNSAGEPIPLRRVLAESTVTIGVRVPQSSAPATPTHRTGRHASTIDRRFDASAAVRIRITSPPIQRIFDDPLGLSGLQPGNHLPRLRLFDHRIDRNPLAVAQGRYCWLLQSRQNGEYAVKVLLRTFNISPTDPGLPSRHAASAPDSRSCVVSLVAHADLFAILVFDSSTVSNTA